MCKLEEFADFLAIKLQSTPEYYWGPICLGYCCESRKSVDSRNELFFSFLEKASKISKIETASGLNQLQEEFRNFWSLTKNSQNPDLKQCLVSFVISNWGGRKRACDGISDRAVNIARLIPDDNQISFKRKDSFVSLTKVGAWIDPFRYQIYDSRVSYALNILYDQFYSEHKDSTPFKRFPLMPRRGAEPIKDIPYLMDKSVDLSFYSEYLELLQCVVARSQQRFFECEEFKLSNRGILKTPTDVERALFMYVK